MFDNITHLKPKKNNALPKSQSIEPHVEYYDIHRAEQSPFLKPIQALFYIALGSTFFSLVWWVVAEEMNEYIRWSMWISGVLCMICLPAWYGFSRSFLHDKKTLLEVDNKYGLIKYTNPERKLNLLFHKSQVEKCEIFKSFLFPFHVQYLVLNLSGGIKLQISSLVIDPREIAVEFTLPYTISRKLFPLSNAV